MILDTKVPLPQHAIIDVLMDSGITFFQTGSRYMGCARDDSDWDFITLDCEETRGILQGLGFRFMRDADGYPRAKDGGLTNEVMEWAEGSITIQVQLSSLPQIKRQVRDLICTFLLREHIKADSGQRSMLWENFGKLLQFKADVVIQIPTDPQDEDSLPF